MKPEEDLLRRALFVPCDTKEDLHRWICVYLGLNLPDTVVDPESNSSPMDLIWEVYNQARRNDDPDFSRVMAYAARDSFKTLGAAILEVLAIFHLRRDVAHMAAVKSQAKKAQSYVKRFFRLPYLRDFVTTKNTEQTDLVWYSNESTGDYISKAQFQALPPGEQLKYDEHEHYIKIVICTLQGANCVSPTTLVTRGDGTTAQAIDLKKGDGIKSFNLKTRQWEVTCVAGIGFVSKQGVRLAFKGGGSVVVSDDHPVMTTKGWVRAWALKKYYRFFNPSYPGAKAVEAVESTELVPSCLPIVDPWMVIRGSLLGDASLTWPSGKNGRYGCGPRLRFGHSKAQYEYLGQKSTALKKLGIDFSAIVENPRHERIEKSEFTIYQTKVEPRLAEIYDQLMVDGKKTVTRDYLNTLNEEAVAYWFMDDGQGNGLDVGARKDQTYGLATCGFSLRENELIVEWFKDRWGLDASVGTVTNSTGVIYPIIRFTLEASRKLTGMIQKFVAASMRYKLVAPSGYTMGRCIECGADSKLIKGNGFTRCPLHPYRSADRAYRKGQKKFSSSFSNELESIEFLGERTFVDVSIDTDKEELRNFIANSLVLLHNSDHVSFFVVDEVDVVPKQNQAAYEEAKAIPAQFEDKQPVTLLISTRKFAFGNVQRELDSADKTGLLSRHWNIIDVTETCPPKRHLPDEPKIPIYMSRGRLLAIGEEQYQQLMPDEQQHYVKEEGYTGCLKNCKVFSLCRGNLATRQKEHPRDEKGRYIEQPRPLLKTIAFTTKKARELVLDMAKAQLMCWKASQEGLIYPMLDRSRHLLTPAQVARKITGEEYQDSFGFQDLLALIRSRSNDPGGCSGRWIAGVDFGFTHMFSVVLIFVDDQNAYVMGRWNRGELDPAEKIDLLDRTIKEFDPTIYADPEQPDMIKFMKKFGYRCQTWKKGPGSVLGGIETVRWKMNPTLGGDPQLYWVAGGPDVEANFRVLSLYHWALGQDGKPTDEPDEVVVRTDDGDIIGDDECDAIRYSIMNAFKARTQGLIVSDDDLVRVPGPRAVETAQQGARTLNETWAKQMLEHAMGGQQDPLEQSQEEAPQRKGRKGSFVFDL